MLAKFGELVLPAVTRSGPIEAWIIALALNRHQQPQAVVMHRPLRIGMAQHGSQCLDIGRKARLTPLA
jgi:hypothetical protein